MTEKPILNPNSIGLFIGFEECPRYLSQTLNQIKGRKGELGVFLSETGKKFENEILQAFQDEMKEFIDCETFDFSKDFNKGQIEIKNFLKELLKNLGTNPIAISQVPLKGKIEDWRISGKSDLVCLWMEDDSIYAHVLEIKGARKVRPYHKIQGKIYSILLRKILEGVCESIQIKTGIVYRGMESSERPLENFPKIKNEEVVEDDIRRLLNEKGTLNRIFEKEPKDLIYQLSPNCNYCQYNENCFIHALRSENLALLGLTQGEQEILQKYDILSLSNLAELKEKPESPRPYNYEELEPLDERKVKALLNEATISKKLDKMIQKAQAMLSKINPDHPQAQTNETIPPIQGSGRSSLPATSSTEAQQEYMDYQPEELIRVYLYIRQDYIRDTLVLLSARTVRECSSESPKSFSILTEELPDQKEKKLNEEINLLSRFLEKLFRNIQSLVDNQDSAPVHLYFFTRMERDWLIKALLRHHSQWDEESFNAVRDLLGYRQAIDQPMVSIVQDEFRNHFANKYPCDGLLPLVWYISNSFCTCGCKNGYFRDSWKTTRTDGKKIDLWKIFHHNFFDFLKQVELNNGQIRINPDISNPDFYPLRARYDNQIPLEYIWAEDEKLNQEWAKNPQQEKEIEKYRWHDHESKNERISREDIKLLGQKLSHALHHLEDSLFYSKNIFLGKRPIDIPHISSISLGQSSLARSSREYLDLEYFANRQEKLTLFAKSPRERIRTGKSAIFEVRNTQPNNGYLLIEGELIYHTDEFEKPERIANSCRLKGREGATSGSHMVMNEVNWNGGKGVHEEVAQEPRNIEDGLPVTILDINASERFILLKASEFHRDDIYFVRRRDQFPYVIPHDTWTPNQNEEGTNYGKNVIFIREGDRYILDEKTDDWVAKHGADILENIDHVQIYRELDNLLGGED